MDKLRAVGCSAPGNVQSLQAALRTMGGCSVGIKAEQADLGRGKLSLSWPFIIGKVRQLTCKCPFLVTSKIFGSIPIAKYFLGKVVCCVDFSKKDQDLVSEQWYCCNCILQHFLE